MAKTKIEVIEFEVGDKVVTIHKMGSHKPGTVVFVHPTDDVKYVVDYGPYWQGEFPEDIKLLPPKEEVTK